MSAESDLFNALVDATKAAKDAVSEYESKLDELRAEKDQAYKAGYAKCERDVRAWLLNKGDVLRNEDDPVGHFVSGGLYSAARDLTLSKHHGASDESEVGGG